jgi:hypothetical protein
LSLKDFITAEFRNARQLTWNPPLVFGRHTPTTVCLSGQGVRSRASRGGVFRSCLLLIGLVAVQIGCAAKPHNTISVPDKPTPLPDPHSRIDAGGNGAHHVSSRLLDRPD